jgi:hypothetical protein
MTGSRSIASICNRLHIERAASAWGCHLWLNRYGRPMRSSAIRTQIETRTKEAFGRHVWPHLFRDCAVTELVDCAPEEIGIAPDLLGHADLQTTQKHLHPGDRDEGPSPGPGSDRRPASRRHPGQYRDKTYLVRELAGVRADRSWRSECPLCTHDRSFESVSYRSPGDPERPSRTQRTATSRHAWRRSWSPRRGTGRRLASLRAPAAHGRCPAAR